MSGASSCAPGSDEARFRAGSADGTWALDGLLTTRRGTRPLHLELQHLVLSRHRVRARASGEIARRDIGFLLARPGCARMLGPCAQLDLLVEATAPAPA